MLCGTCSTFGILIGSASGKLKQETGQTATQDNQKHVHEAEARGRRQWINTIERHRSALPGHNIYSKKWRDIYLIFFFFEFLPDDVREEWIPLDRAFWEEIGPLWLTKCIVPPDLEDRGERCLTTLLARSLWKAAGAAVTLRYLSGCQNGQQPTKRLTNAHKLFQGLPEIQKVEDSPFMTQHARCEKMGENEREGAWGCWKGCRMMNGNSWSKIVVLLDAKRLLITSWYLSLMFGSAFTAAHPSLLQPLNLLGLSTGGTSNIWRRHFLSYPPSLGGKGIRCA